MELMEIINGGLLGDASIRVRENKYFYFNWYAKSVKFLEWLKGLLEENGITNSYISLSSSKSQVYLLGFYINKHPQLLDLRQKWYANIDGKTVKIVPGDLQLTPTTLLFWYLGDGSLSRRKNDESRIPAVVLATNNFSLSDVLLLQKKLAEIGLNFYLVRYKSGFTGKYCGYALRSKTSDETPYKFFELIGFVPPKEIANAVTGRKGKGSKLHKFKDKWPNEDEILKMMSNVKALGKILKKRRKQLGLTQKELARLVGISTEHLKRVENGKRFASFKVLKSICKTLGLTFHAGF